MRAFTENEIAYLTTQRLGRLATVGADGAPHVSPVGFRYNPDLETIDIGGRAMGQTKKWRDVQRDGRVAFVVDDVPPPWQPRGIEIRGVAQAIDEGGTHVNGGFAPELIRISPKRIVAWGLDSGDDQPNARSVE